MMATTLYTAQVLGLAASLSDYPWDETLPLSGEARSKSCGSTITLGCATDAEGRIARLGIKSHACAIGQASAAIYAQAAVGRTLDEIARSGLEIASWLSGETGLPDWPGISVLTAARNYPARHGAITLAWRATDDMLPTTQLRR